MTPRIPSSGPPPILRAVLETFAHKAAEEAATHLLAIVADEARALIHRFKLKHGLYLDTTPTPDPTQDPQETAPDGDTKDGQDLDNEDEADH